MTTKRILAIDQGTTSTRAVMFDDRAKPLATAQIPLPQIYPRDGWVEHDPEEIWKATVQVCRDVIAQTGGVDGVVAIGITNQRETSVIWDRKTRQAIHNAIVWQDRRGAPQCDELRAQGKDKVIQARTGLVIDSYFSATKAAWLMKNVPDARTQADKDALAFGTIDTFLLWRLTGGKVHATDATNASRTMLYDIHKGVWDRELLDLFNVPASLLPEVKNTTDDFGTTTPDLFGAPIPIRALVGDQQSALVGQAGFREGLIKCTFGTGCFVLINTGSKAFTSKNKLLTTIAYKLNGKTTYALEGSVFNAGTAVQWLRDQLKLFGTAAESEELAKSAHGTSRTYFVPAFTGLGAPHWDPDARGAILGITRDTSAAQIVRAALEGVCMQTQDLLATFIADGVEKPAALRVDGGMSANNWMMQFLSDVSGLVVERPQYRETTVLGAAFLAGLGAGVFGSLSDVESAWARDFTASPGMRSDARQAVLTGWAEAVRRVRGPIPGNP
ncbi:MAG: glycerol kinase GlpK [Rhodospirillaceae bacterium]|nr:glycerol kinase GlpK [Rhodospirillaceae bacterium]